MREEKEREPKAFQIRTIDSPDVKMFDTLEEAQNYKPIFSAEDAKKFDNGDDEGKNAA